MLRGGQNATGQLESGLRSLLLGALLALFFVLGPFLGAFCALLAAFWITVGRFLCVLDRSGLDFEVFWERSGSPRALFFEVFQRIWMDVGLFFALAPNTQKPRKNIGFSMIFAYRACYAQNKKTIKNRSRSLSDKASHKYGF